MNRIEMAGEIKLRVPDLARREKLELRTAEKLRQKFVRDYPIERLSAMPLQKYVIGKGKKTFCYRIERELHSSGSILGYQAFKFGIYFGKEKGDPANAYRFKPKWGVGPDQAFAAVKAAIESLLRAAKSHDLVAVSASTLTPMFKGKLLATYEPEYYAPVFSKEHLAHFAAELNLPGALEDEPSMQRALMKYRATWPELMAYTPVLFMKFLYRALPLVTGPNRPINGAAQVRIPMLEDAINGIQLLSQLPESPEGTPGGRGGWKKIDQEERNRRTKRIGDRGEEIAFYFERQRLTAAGRSDLAERVEHVSQTNDTLGYDIRSFEADGTPRHVEVKSTSAEHMGLGFFLSENERVKSTELENYHLYLVFSALSKKPRLFQIKSPNFGSDALALHPVTYLVGPK